MFLAAHAEPWNSGNPKWKSLSGPSCPVRLDKNEREDLHRR
jgi:hypothetical protein